MMLMRDAVLQINIIVHRRPIGFHAITEAIGLLKEVTALVGLQVHSFHELWRDRHAVPVRGFFAKHIC